MDRLPKVEVGGEAPSRRRPMCDLPTLRDVYFARNRWESLVVGGLSSDLWA